MQLRPQPAMSKPASQITGLSKLSKSEKCVTFSGNIRASYLNFSLDYEDGSDDEGWSSGEEERVETSVQQHPDIADFSNRKLETFDLPQVKYPDRIKYLYLSHNVLKKLPENIFLVLPNLEWLDVRNNQLGFLPNLNSHQKIRTILAEYNNIEQLPEDLHTAPKLTRLQLGGNKISASDSRLLRSGLGRVRGNQSQDSSKHQHRHSFDSGIGIKDLSETESETWSEDSRSECKVSVKRDDEVEEINDFIENKDLYAGKKLDKVEEEFNFDDYLYCYKSFHSPYLDKQFEGFSLKDIQSAALRVEKRKKEQENKKQINLALESLHSRAALAAWRDHYRQQSAVRARSYERADTECTMGHNVSPPHGQDPDWTIANSALPDTVFSPAVNKASQSIFLTKITIKCDSAQDVSVDDVVKAIEVTEEEIDHEVSRAVRSAGRPGRLDKVGELS